jgi:hypothetical protein
MPSQSPERISESTSSSRKDTSKIPQKSRFFRRKLLLRVLAGLLTIYLCFGTYVWWSMHQSPEVFGRVMARMPGPVPFLLFPFETAWTHARAGTLHTGDAAPDFSLMKLDKSERLRLSAFSEQHRPVVLIFGSYT